jgi:NodT family efflux transporter outer membrane factor (OMF) lipoprotein
MRYSRRLVLAALLGSCAVSACTVGPDFSVPQSTHATAWHQKAPDDAAVSPAADPDPRWWNAFRDPVLTDLIEAAIADNPSLREAVLRVVEARQSVVTARAAGLPTLNGTASYMREQIGARGILESQGAYKQLNALADANSPLNKIAPGLGAQASSTGTGLLNQLDQPINLFQYGLDASWELDLFGRVRRSVEQAKASEVAQKEATNDALLMLESEVAQVYVQLRGAQALAADQQQTVAADQQILSLTTRLARQGLNTTLDVDQARTQLFSDAQQLPGFEKQTQQALDQLNTLVGQAPGTIDKTLANAAPLPTLPPIIGIGLPSTLARRRPDIREAEAQLHAATAGVGVAVASFYPDISLTGNLGIRAIDASYLTRWASHFYSAGPSVSLPIFQGGRLAASLRMARAQQSEAALQYRNTVLNALREVEDGLVAYRTDRTARDDIGNTVSAAGESLYLAQNRYANGLSDFIQVLDAQRSMAAARQQAVQADITLVDDVVGLYRAAGGGWQQESQAMPPPAVAAPPPPVPGALDSVVH